MLPRSLFLEKFAQPKTHQSIHRLKQEAPPPAPLADKKAGLCDRRAVFDWSETMPIQSRL